MRTTGMITIGPEHDDDGDDDDFSKANLDWVVLLIIANAFYLILGVFYVFR
jgi:hypothetical protein